MEDTEIAAPAADRKRSGSGPGSRRRARSFRADGPFPARRGRIGDALSSSRAERQTKGSLPQEPSLARERSKPPVGDHVPQPRPIRIGPGSEPGSRPYPARRLRHPAGGDGEEVHGREVSAASSTGAFLLLANRVCSALAVDRRGIPRPPALGLVGRARHDPPGGDPQGRRLDVPAAARPSRPGKELVPCLHDAGPRRRRGFMAVNMGAVPPTWPRQSYSERRAAPSRGDPERIGYFAGRRRHPFLDEIGETPARVQSLSGALTTGDPGRSGGDLRRWTSGSLLPLPPRPTPTRSRVSGGASERAPPPAERYEISCRRCAPPRGFWAPSPFPGLGVEGTGQKDGSPRHRALRMRRPVDRLAPTTAWKGASSASRRAPARHRADRRSAVGRHERLSRRPLLAELPRPLRSLIRHHAHWRRRGCPRDEMLPRSGHRWRLSTRRPARQLPRSRSTPGSTQPRLQAFDSQKSSKPLPRCQGDRDAMAKSWRFQKGGGAAMKSLGGGWGRRTSGPKGLKDKGTKKRQPCLCPLGPYVLLVLLSL